MINPCVSVLALVEKSTLREEECWAGPVEALSVSFPVKKRNAPVLHLLSGFNEDYPEARALP